MEPISVPSPDRIFEIIVPSVTACKPSMAFGVNTLVKTVMKTQTTSVKANKNLKFEQLLLIKRFEAFSNNISIVHKNIRKLKNEVMNKYGLLGNHGIFLSYLLLYRDGLTVSQLSEIIGADKAAVSRAYASLYRKGYIDYPNFFGDKKYNTPAVITESGQKIMEPIVETISSLIDSISLTDIEEDDRTTMYRTLRTTAKNIEKCVEEEMWDKK